MMLLDKIQSIRIQTLHFHDVSYVICKLPIRPCAWWVPGVILALRSVATCGAASSVHSESGMMRRNRRNTPQKSRHDWFLRRMPYGAARCRIGCERCLCRHIWRISKHQLRCWAASLAAGSTYVSASGHTCTSVTSQTEWLSRLSRYQLKPFGQFPIGSTTRLFKAWYVSGLP